MKRNPPHLITKLEEIPNVGPAIATDLRGIGIDHPKALKGKDPVKLYRLLCETTGFHHDPCVLDTFMAAVHFMETGESRTWWSFTEERKALQKREEI